MSPILILMFSCSNLNIEINHPHSLSLSPLHLDQVEPDKIVDGLPSNSRGHASHLFRHNDLFHCHLLKLETLNQDGVSEIVGASRGSGLVKNSNPPEREFDPSNLEPRFLPRLPL